MKKRTLALRMLAGVMAGAMFLTLAGCEDVDEDEGRGSIKDVEEEPDEEPEPTEEAEPTEAPTEEPTPTEEEEPTETPTEAPQAGGNTAPGELSDDLYDYQISINGEVLQIPMYVSDLQAKGWAVNTRMSDLNDTLRPDSYDLYYFEKGDVRICVDVLNWDVNEQTAGNCVINGIMIDRYDAEDAEVQMAGGLDWNMATYEDIISVYGTPSYENETSSLQFIRYEEDTYNEVEFQIDLDNGQIHKIDINNYVKPEDFVEGEVSTDIPEVTTKYQAPTKMSDDPADFIIEVEGALYQFPCPVSEFVKNGWEIVESESEESVDGRGSGKVTLRKNNFEFWEYVKNYDDNATAIENCFLMDFDVRDQDARISVKIAGGVEYHQSVDEAKKILEPMGFTFEDGTIAGSGYYTLSYGSFKEYELYTSDGIIKNISLSNQLKRDELFQ